EDLQLLQASNAAGETVRYAYDDRGNQTAFTDPSGVTTRFTYHDDLLVRRDDAGRVTEYAHDARGLLVSVRYPTGAWLSLSYDEHGRMSSVSGPEGRLHDYGYDVHHNVVEERTARGGVL